jgi:hypothetical protein
MTVRTLVAACSLSRCSSAACRACKSDRALVRSSLLAVNVASSLSTFSCRDECAIQAGVSYKQMSRDKTLASLSGSWEAFADSGIACLLLC